MFKLSPLTERASQRIAQIGKILFIIVFIALILRVLDLQHRLTNAQRAYVHLRHSISQARFAPGDYMDGALLEGLDGQTLVFNARTLKEPSLFAILDLSCPSCMDGLEGLSRELKEHPAHPVRFISRGTSTEVKSLLFQRGLLNHAYLLPSSASDYLKFKCSSYPQYVLVLPGGIIGEVFPGVKEAVQWLQTDRSSTN